MIIHYLKIAFRNMWKYKSQTLISVIGLAIGFICFALAALWIVYEMTYDSFQKNAKYKYTVYVPSAFSSSGYTRSTPYPLAAYLRETFPEIADAAIVDPAPFRATVDSVEFPASFLLVDSSFLRLFDVKIIEGSSEFLIPDSRKLAITEEKARQLFGNEHPIGKTVSDQTICAVVSGMSKRSNYPYDFIGPVRAWKVTQQSWNATSNDNTIIELFPGTNIEAFEKKLYEHDVGEGRTAYAKKMMIKPITKMRYLDPDMVREVKFQHIVIFAFSGLLVILCALFNYLNLFISRFRIRQKELALRVVCGASEGSLLSLLSVEFLLTLLFAVLSGFMLTLALHKPFLSLSEIKMDLHAVYRELLTYIGGVILSSLCVFRLLLFVFRQRSLNQSIRRSHKKLFRKSSVVAQLVISMGFAYCAIVMLKQMYFLQHTDELGFSFQNRGAVTVYQANDSEVLANQLKQIPEILEAVPADEMVNLVPLRNNMAMTFNSWDDKPADVGNISLNVIYVSQDYIDFYNFRLLAGEMLTNADPDSLVLINESAAKALGWHDPVGKRFYENKFTVKGVIRNVYNFAPTTLAKPVFYTKPMQNMQVSSGANVLIKYREGMWNSCKEKIVQLLSKEYTASEQNINIFNNEEEYSKYLKSENALIKLLSFVSAICILICVFGFVSLVSLACEERRKSIAIRKINGATTGDILVIFAKEYSLLLIIGASVAFPIGYFVMHRWLEQYVKQSVISAWIYLSILFIMAMVIVICVGLQVYKTSVQNPAEEINN